MWIFPICFNSNFVDKMGVSANMTAYVVDLKSKENL